MTATTDQPIDPPGGPVTTTDVPATAALGATDDYPIEADDLDDELLLPTRRRRIGPLTSVLILVLVAGLGVYGGIWYQKNHGHSSTASTASIVSALASRFGAAGRTGAGTGTGTGGTGRSGAGTGSFGGFGGAGGGSTVGTVKLVDGNTIYLTQTDGSIVRVNTTPSGTTVSKTVSSSVSAIQPGETLVVQGSTGSDGTVTATRVTDAGATTTGSDTTGASGTGATGSGG